VHAQPPVPQPAFGQQPRARVGNRTHDRLEAEDGDAFVVAHSTAPSRSRLRYAPGSSSNCAIVWRHSAGIGTGLKSGPTNTSAALDVTNTSSAARTS